jgi:hypothetical protein
MATPESNEKTIQTKKDLKRGKDGLRGVPFLDVVNNKSIMVNDGKKTKDGKLSREGHTKIDSDTINTLNKAGKELKIGRAALIRKVLQSFCMYFTEAKALGGNPFFNTPKTYEMWLQERSDVKVLMNEIIKINNTMQENSKSPEVKLLSQQMVALTKMMNLTHKTVL